MLLGYAVDCAFCYLDATEVTINLRHFTTDLRRTS